MAPPRATDVGWLHGAMVNGDRQKIKCKYCSKVILGGGISRLKQHLAGERGNIVPCKKVPDDVKTHFQQHMGFKILEKLNKQKETENLSSSVQNFGEEVYDADLGNVISVRGVLGKNRGREVEAWSAHKKRTQRPLVSQSTLNSTFSSQESIDQADITVAKFMYDAGIPFNAANSYYFQKMADAIAAVGPGYKMPSYQSLRGRLLNKCRREVGEISKEIQKSWEVTGCTIMADRWVDRIGRVVINFFVYCPKGTVLLKSVEASDIENYCDGLVSLFDSILQEVGIGNVVNFITDTTPSNKNAGKMLMNKYKTFFCSTCANHSIELMLKELSELNDVKEVLAKAKIVCQYIYNNSWVLNLMRKITEGTDIFQPATTEIVTKFLTLDSMSSLKDSLYHMFTSTLWRQSALSKHRAATWWSLYASDYPELQRFAIRILSQACSITTSERNWTMNECTHSGNKNRLEQEKMTDLTFVHYNLRLQRRQLATSESKSLMGTEHDPISFEGWNLGVGEWIEDPGVADSNDTSWMNVAMPGDDDNSIGAIETSDSMDS